MSALKKVIILFSRSNGAEKLRSALLTPLGRLKTRMA